MAPARVSNHWSVSLASPRTRRPRWLSESGRLTSDPARALRLLSPEVAAQRVQQFLQMRGWEPELMERFQLVPAPRLEASAPPPSRLLRREGDGVGNGRLAA